MKCDLQKAQLRITELEAKLEAMRETYTLAMRGAGLERYGIEWQGQENPISVPMNDGYWTPWHIAQLRITELEAQIRPAEGLPTYKELAKSVMNNCFSRRNQYSQENPGALTDFSFAHYIGGIFGSEWIEDATALCTALNRDPETGEGVE